MQTSAADRLLTDMWRCHEHAPSGLPSAGAPWPPTQLRGYPMQPQVRQAGMDPLLARMQRSFVGQPQFEAQAHSGESLLTRMRATHAQALPEGASAPPVAAMRSAAAASTTATRATGIGERPPPRRAAGPGGKEAEEVHRENMQKRWEEEDKVRRRRAKLEEDDLIRQREDLRLQQEELRKAREQLEEQRKAPRSPQKQHQQAAEPPKMQQEREPPPLQVLQQAEGLECAAAGIGRLHLLADSQWLARELGLATAPGAVVQASVPEVVVDVARLWPLVWASLPAPAFGCGAYTQYFGLLFAGAGACHSEVTAADVDVRTDAESGGPQRPVRLQSAELCPHPFVWQATTSASSSSCGDAGAVAAAAVDDLNHQLQAFLLGSFAPWLSARHATEEASAWLVCNDGDSFALSSTLLAWLCSGSCSTGPCEHDGDAGSLEDGIEQHPRRPDVVVVVDRAKSSADEAALEVFGLPGAGKGGGIVGAALPPPRRLLFEVVGP